MEKMKKYNSYFKILYIPFLFILVSCENKIKENKELDSIKIQQPSIVPAVYEDSSKAKLKIIINEDNYIVQYNDSLLFKIDIVEKKPLINKLTSFLEKEKLTKFNTIFYILGSKKANYETIDFVMKFLAEKNIDQFKLITEPK